MNTFPQSLSLYFWRDFAGQSSVGDGRSYNIIQCTLIHFYARPSAPVENGLAVVISPGYTSPYCVSFLLFQSAFAFLLISLA